MTVFGRGELLAARQPPQRPDASQPPSFEGHRRPPVRKGPISGVGRSDQDAGSHDGRNSSTLA